MACRFWVEPSMHGALSAHWLNSTKQSAVLSFFRSCSNDSAGSPVLRPNASTLHMAWLLSPASRAAANSIEEIKVDLLSFYRVERPPLHSLIRKKNCLVLQPSGCRTHTKSRLVLSAACVRFEVLMPASDMSCHKVPSNFRRSLQPHIPLSVYKTIDDMLCGGCYRVCAWLYAPLCQPKKAPGGL
ncbi:hypothetical protein GQ54DRAFT_6547 [Martensiomyces pterosporus]|nr:hypothetical protein GQ54DRAFT_6547 [Martensiomyces pterosporus]